ncbi:MAG: DUF2797 domain-containing protein [Candidatus Thorarchaeota archaeon]
MAQDDGTFTSGLRVWNGGDSPEFLPVTPGENLSWIIRGPRRCIGSIDSSLKSVRCPENSLVFQTGKTRCGPCSGMDFVDPCIRCDGRTCRATPARKEQCDKTKYAVYFVVFNDEIMKVGVSSEKRVRTRWVEQGADYGGILEVVEGGMNARRIEDRLGKNPNLAKQVRGERKIRGLMNKINQSTAQALVDHILMDIQSDNLLRPIELEDLSDYYSLRDLTTQPVPWRKRSDQIEDRPMIGDVVGMKGSLLVTRLGSVFTVVDLKQLIGYSLDYDKDITVVTQTGLMDFC